MEQVWRDEDVEQALSELGRIRAAVERVAFVVSVAAGLVLLAAIAAWATSNG